MRIEPSAPPRQQARENRRSDGPPPRDYGPKGKRKEGGKGGKFHRKGGKTDDWMKKPSGQAAKPFKKKFKPKPKRD